MDTLTLTLDPTLHNMLLAFGIHGETLEDTALRLLPQAVQGVVPVPDPAKKMLVHWEVCVSSVICWESAPGSVLN